MHSEGTPLPNDADQDDFDFDHLRSIMLKAIARRCPPFLRDQQEDIVQEAMIRVLQRKEKMPAGQRVEPGYWVRAAQNALIDETRRRRWEREEPWDPQSEEIRWSSSLPGPDRQYSLREFGRAYFDCLEGLPGPRIRAVTLWVHGHTAKEAGKILKAEVRKVQNLTFRGRQDLQDCLRQKGIGP